MGMEQEQPFKQSIVNLNRANNIPTTQPAALSFTFSSSHPFNNKIENNNIKIFISQSMEHARVNNTSSENSSSNSTSEHNNGNSNSFISNNNSSQLTSETNSKMASNSASLLDMKNSLNLAPSNSNSLKRKNTSREFINGDESFQNSNGAKVFLSEKKSLASNDSRSVSYNKSYILNNLNLSKNLKVNHEDSNGNENDNEDEDEDEDGIDDEDLEEEDQVENDDDDDLEDGDDDDDDEDEVSDDEQLEEMSNISGVKKMESTEEIIAIDSENDEDTNPDDNEFDDDDDEFENDEEYISNEATADKPAEKEVKQNSEQVLEETYKVESENRNNRKESEEIVNSDANDKIMVSKLLNRVDYEDENEETQEESNSVSRFSAPSLNNEENKITTENKENLAVEDASLVRKSPKEIENQKEAMNQSFNILKSPITRGDFNEKLQFTNDVQLSNEENLELNEGNNRNAIEEAMMQSEITNQDVYIYIFRSIVF